MVVAKQTGFFDPVFDYFFHAGAERNFPKGHRGTAAGQIPFDFQTDLFCRKPHFFQNHEGDAVGLTQDGQDQVLRPEIIVLVPLGFFTREDNDLPTLVRESFEHPASLSWMPVLGAFDKTL